MYHSARLIAQPRLPSARGAALFLASTALLASATIVACAAGTTSNEPAGRLARFAFTGSFRFHIAPSAMPSIADRPASTSIVVAAARPSAGRLSDFYTQRYLPLPPAPGPGEAPMAAPSVPVTAAKPPVKPIATTVPAIIEAPYQARLHATKAPHTAPTPTTATIAPIRTARAPRAAPAAPVPVDPIRTASIAAAPTASVTASKSPSQSIASFTPAKADVVHIGPPKDQAPPNVAKPTIARTTTSIVATASQPASNDRLSRQPSLTTDVTDRANLPLSRDTRSALGAAPVPSDRRAAATMTAPIASTPAATQLEPVPRREGAQSAPQAAIATIKTSSLPVRVAALPAPTPAAAANAGVTVLPPLPTLHLRPEEAKQPVTAQRYRPAKRTARVSTKSSNAEPAKKSAKEPRWMRRALSNID